MSTIKPKNDHVLIKRDDSDSKTKGGLFIPETAQEKSIFAKVVAVGPGKWLDTVYDPINPPEHPRRRKPLVEPGDRVVIEKWKGSEIDVNGEPHLFVREDDILAVVAND